MTLALEKEATRPPPLIIGDRDLQRVTVAALIDVSGSSDDTDFLLAELDRAQVVPEAELPPDVVRIGSIVSYESTSGDRRTVKLLMPVDAQPQGTYRLSVTSAHGAALLGLRPDAVMTWMNPDGQRHRIRVIDVRNPGN
jgi:regulator of nucleoside diphosphate kinase